MKLSRRGFGPRVAVFFSCLMVAAAIVLALVAHQSSAPGIRVWVSARQLPAGLVIAASDVRSVSVAVPAQTVGLMLRTSPVGKSLTRVAMAGALLTKADLVSASSGAVRLVTLAVDAGRAPATLSRGAVVDVWATPTGSWDTAAGGSRRVASSVVVSAVSRSDPTGGLAIKIQVPAAGVARLIAATHAGGIDIVEVPRSDAGAS